MTTNTAATLLPNRNTTAPAGYDSIVPAHAFDVEGITDGLTGCHYDYRAQSWRDGHDHAHVDAACMLPALYCGSDLATCQGIPR